MAAPLQPGDEAPDFTLDDDTGAPVRLADLRGGSVVVYFYPAAMTPGCTTQARDFQAAREDLAAQGFTVLGISVDPPDRLAEFRRREGLTFRLLSDPDHRVHEAYGAWGERTSYGRRSVGPIRSTFLLDPDGRVRQASYGVRAAGHVERLLRSLADA